MARSVQVLYFAALRDLVGSGEERLELPPEVRSIGELGALIEALHPPLAGRLTEVRFALDEVFVDAQEPLTDGGTVALIPPVCGG